MNITTTVLIENVTELGFDKLEKAKPEVFIDNLTDMMRMESNNCLLDAQKVIAEMFGYYSKMIITSGLWVLLSVGLYFALDVYKAYRLKKFEKLKNDDLSERIHFLQWIYLIQRLIVLFMFIAGARMIQLGIWSLG